MRIPDPHTLAGAPRIVPVVLALGSNLGARGELLLDAVAALKATPGILIDRVSPVVESAALKLDGIDPDAPRYLNAVALGRTWLRPVELLAEVNRIEAERGRVRAERWGDRTLDIDIVEYNGQVSDDPVVTLPHPRAWQRDFVLAPWLLADADAALTDRGPVEALLAAVGDGTVVVPGIDLEGGAIDRSGTTAAGPAAAAISTADILDEGQTR